MIKALKYYLFDMSDFCLMKQEVKSMARKFLAISILLFLVEIKMCSIKMTFSIGSIENGWLVSRVTGQEGIVDDDNE